MSETVAGIRIECKLDANGIKKGRKEVESEMDSMAEAIENGSEEAAEAMIREFEEAADGIKGLFGSFAPKDDSAAGLADYIKQVKEARKQLEGEFEELQNSIRENSKTAGYDPTEDQAALDVMRAQYREYTADIDAATESLRQLREYESRIGDGSVELKTAVADQDMLSKIQSEQEYQAILSRTEDRMRMIANEAERIAREKGFSTRELLSVNVEYQKLARTQKVLIENQSDFSRKTASAAGEAKKLEKATKNVEKSLKSSKKNANGFSSAMTSGMKKIGKAALAVFGIQALYSGIQKLSNQYLSQNEDLSSRIQSMWNVAGQAVGPVIEKMVGWLEIATAHANAFVKALTGVDLVAKANAEALKKQASAAKEAAQQAGFDEINKISDTSSATTQSAVFETQVDTSGVERVVKWMKGTFTALSDRFKELFGPSIMAWGEAFVNLKDPIAEACDSIGSSWNYLKEESLGPFSTWMSEEWVPGIYNTFSGDLAPVFSDVMTVAVEQFALDFKQACLDTERAINDHLKAPMETLKTIWIDVCNTLKSEWDEKGGALLEKFQTFKDGLREIWNELYERIVGPIITKFNGLLDGLWQKHLKPLWDNLVGFLGNLFEMVLNLWNNVLKPVLGWLVDFLSPIIQWVVDVVLDKIRTFAAFVADAVNGLLKILSGVCEFLSGIFTLDFKKALNGLIEIVNGLIQFLWAGLSGLINLLVDGLNALWTGLYSAVASIVNGLGSIISDIGDVIGEDWGGWEIPKDAPKIGRFEVPAPQIPRLARGGIVNNPGRGVPAIIGEAGREAVLPLDQNTEWMDVLADKVFAGGQIVLNIILNGRVIQKEIRSIAELRRFATNGGNV